MEDIDLDKLREKLFELTRQLLSGEEIKTAHVRITVKVPELLYDAISDVGDQLGIGATEAFEKLATEGIMEKMKSLVNSDQSTAGPAPAAGFEEAAKSLKDNFGLDVSGLIGGLEKMKTMLPQLQHLEKVMQNAGLATEPKVQRPSGPSTGQQDTPENQENPE